MPVAPRVPSDPATPEFRLAQPQGGVRTGPSCFGPDYDGPPVTDAHNHIEAITTAYQGRPTPAEMIAKGVPPPPPNDQ